MKTIDLIFLFSGWLVSCNSHSEYKTLKHAASEINKRGHLVGADSTIRLDTVLAFPNDTIEFDYTLLKVQKERMYIESTKDSEEVYVIPNVNNLGYNIGLKDIKATVIIKYWDKQKQLIYSVAIPPSKYKNKVKTID